MAFYCKPPRGKLSYSKLEDGVKIRMKFLLGVHKCNGNLMQLQDLVQETCTVEDSEWLIDGSKKDLISHFFCRLACAQTPDMRSFLVTAETMLFRYRITCMREEELLHTIENVSQLLTEINHKQCRNPQLQQIASTLNHLTERCALSTVVRNYYKGTNMQLLLPFQSVLHLVGKRKVALQNGYAIVPVTSLCEILVPLFEDFLKYGMRLAYSKWKTAQEDTRMRRLFLHLKAMFFHIYPSLSSLHPQYALRCDDIDHALATFPPCMAQFHKTLRKTHRLPHHARIQYTLFLKECGVPINEAILFWQREYSQPSEHSTCTHSWNKDGPRYTYSIRHLYGLEGARKNYRGHSCHSIQSTHVTRAQNGGCPLSHNDAASLQSMMTHNALPSTVQSSILQAASCGQFGSACGLYLRGKLLQNVGLPDVENVELCDGSKCAIKSTDEALVESEGCGSKSKRPKVDLPTLPSNGSNLPDSIKEPVSKCSSKSRDAVIQTKQYRFKSKCSKMDTIKDTKEDSTKSLLSSNNTPISVSTLKVQTLKLEVSKVKSEHSCDQVHSRTNVGYSINTEIDAVKIERKICDIGGDVKRKVCAEREVKHEDKSLFVVVRNPVDYFVSYRKLLEGLESS